MAEVSAAPKAGPDHDSQNSLGFDKDFNDLAFFSIVEDLKEDSAEEKASVPEKTGKGHVRTIADLKEQLVREAAQKAQAEKTKELARLLDNTDDRRRGLMAIYADDRDKIKDMSDADVEAFIAEKTNDEIIKPPTTPEIAAPAGEEPKPRPTGFPTREELKADLEESDPVERGLLDRARLLVGAPGRMVWKGYSKLFDKAAQRSERYAAMTPDEQEKYKKKIALRSTIGAAVIAAVMYGFKADSLAHHIGGSTGSAHTPDQPPADHPQDHKVDPKFEHDRHVADLAYHADDPLDPLKNPARREYDFGAALNLSSAEAAREDLLEGLKHNPTQLAAAMGNFGLIPNDKASIDNIADLMKSQPEVLAANYDHLHDVAMSTSVHLTPTQTVTYGSYSAMPGDGGVTLLAYDPHVTDTQPFLVFDTPNGGTCFGGHCRQPIDLPGPATATASPAVSVAPAAEHPVQNVVGNQPHQGTGNGDYHPQPQPGHEQPAPQPQGDHPAPQPNQPTPSTPDTPVPDHPTPDTPQPHPSDAKDYSGGVPTAPGIVAALNQFLGNTPPPEAGNGTGGPNMNPGVAPGAVSPNTAGGANPSTAGQIPDAQPGANGATGFNRDPQGYADQQAAQRARAAQDAANAAGSAMDSKMNKPGANDQAVKDAISKMDSSGRPKTTTPGAGTGTGFGTGTGTGFGAGTHK